MNLGGDVENAVLFSVGMKLNPYATVAALIDEACKGFGTDEKLLMVTLIRYQSILKKRWIKRINRPTARVFWNASRVKRVACLNMSWLKWLAASWMRRHGIK